MSSSFWDERYGGEKFFYGTEANQFLVSQVGHFTPGGRLLCLGEGEGRNAVFLAGQGFEVTALDACATGLKKAEQLASQRGVKIQTLVADLNDFDPGDQCWDGILSIWCHLPSALRKRVHASCARALKPGGLFLLEAYRPAQLEMGTGGPKDVDMLPTLESLRQDFPSLQALLAQELEREVLEGAGHTGASAVVQWVARRPAQVEAIRPTS